MTLDQLLQLHGSDKATVHANPHCYAPYYEKYFEPLREKEITLLEIGVGSGNSLKAWLDYFPNARIFGLDITPGDSIRHERYVQMQGDQGSPEFWNGLDLGPLDVVIDDGSHRNSDIITTWKALWTHVKPGGIYAIEDLYCAYLPELQSPGVPDTMSFIRGLMDTMNHGSYEIEHLHFSRELAIFKKA